MSTRRKVTELANSDYSVAASKVRAILKEKGVNAVTTVPDFLQFALHDALRADPEVTYVECSAENQALTTAMGMYVGGLEPIVMMQNQGLLNCLNSLRSVGIDGSIPLVLFVGAFGREFSNLGKPLIASTRVMVSRTGPVTEALGLPFYNIETEADMPKIGEAFDVARRDKTAAVVHFGYFPGWA